jgi:hypothetical protein
MTARLLFLPLLLPAQTRAGDRGYLITADGKANAEHNYFHLVLDLLFVFVRPYLGFESGIDVFFAMRKYTPF